MHEQMLFPCTKIFRLNERSSGVVFFFVQKFKTGGDNFIPLIARWPGKRLEKPANYLLTVFAHWCLTVRFFHCY